MTEHAKGLKEKHDENPLYKHVQTSHENESVKFDYVHTQVLFQPPDKIGPTNIMNSKSDFKQGVVPRIEMVTGI